MITITKTTRSNLKELDFNNIPLGRSFTDHMFISDYRDGNWEDFRIVPLEHIPTHPAAMALHYGQAIFEGMKATLNPSGTPLLFRPFDNARRLNESAERLGMPPFSEEMFVEALKKFVALEKDWIPPQKGSALYLRPFMYADEPFIGMRAAVSYKFIVIASPSGPLYSKPVKLYAETRYIRAAKGGTGQAKAAGNYAAAIHPTELVKAKGYDQILWLDALEHKYIQEVGTMNVFFKIDGKFITPQLDGCILDGITRKSVIALLRHKGFEVDERRVTIDEIKEASRKGTLEEAFGSGTAVGIAEIGSITHGDDDLSFPKPGETAQWVNDMLHGIKTGAKEDTFGWTVAAEDEKMPAS